MSDRADTAQGSLGPPVTPSDGEVIVLKAIRHGLPHDASIAERLIRAGLAIRLSAGVYLTTRGHQAILRSDVVRGELTLSGPARQRFERDADAITSSASRGGVVLVWRLPEGVLYYYRGRPEDVTESARALSDAARRQSRDGWRLVREHWTAIRASATDLERSDAQGARDFLIAGHDPHHHFWLE